MKTLSNRILVALALVVSCAVVYLASFTHLLRSPAQQSRSLPSIAPPSLGELERIARSDPAADAAKAMATNDFRFVAISGRYAPTIPGVPNYDERVYTNGISWVDGHGRGLSSRTFEKAIEYAEAYNKIVLGYMKQTK